MSMFGKASRFCPTRARLARVGSVVCGLLAILLFVSACSGAPPATVIVTPQVIIITQVVTQVIPPTPLPATNTPVPTNTAVPPTVTPTAFDPLSAPIYYPLADCVASRLHVGDIAMVSLVGGSNGIRYGRDLSEASVAVYAQPGDKLEIVNGPYCSQGWIVWMVKTGDGYVGFTPEGNGNEYWLLPTAP